MAHDDSDFLPAGKPVSSSSSSSAASGGGEGGTHGWQDDFMPEHHAANGSPIPGGPFSGGQPAGQGDHYDPLDRPAPPAARPKGSILGSRSMRLSIIAGVLGVTALGLAYPFLKGVRPANPLPLPTASSAVGGLAPLANLPGVMPMSVPPVMPAETPPLAGPAPISSSSIADGGGHMDRVERNLEAMTTTMSRISDAMAQVSDAVTQTQGKVTAFETRVTGMSADLSKLDHRETGLEGRVKKLERAVLGRRIPARHGRRASLHSHPVTVALGAQPRPAGSYPANGESSPHWELRGVSQQRSRIVLANGVDGDGQARLTTFDVGKSTLPGWGRILEVRPATSGHGLWEVVTEKGIALTGGAAPGLMPAGR